MKKGQKLHDEKKPWGEQGKKVYFWRKSWKRNRECRRSDGEHLKGEKPAYWGGTQVKKEPD